MRYLLALLAFAVVALAGDPSPQKFKVTVTITYDSLTLREAAAIEEQARKEFKGGTVKLQIAEIATMLSPRFLGVDTVAPYLPWWKEKYGIYLDSTPSPLLRPLQHMEGYNELEPKP